MAPGARDTLAGTGPCSPSPVDARTWSRTYLRIADPDPFMAARLDVSDLWMDGTGQWLAIADEPSSHLWALLTYLRFHAPSLMAQAAPGARVSADDWLASRRLVRGIDAELARRGESDPDGAIVTVRAIGFTPWELGA